MVDAWGDLTREAYRADRERLEAELATLRGADDRASLVGRAAAFLRDLPEAWQAATPEQRNQLARLVFHSIEVAHGQVVAVVPQADFAPFFVLAEHNEMEQTSEAAPDRHLLSLAGGSDGIPSNGCILPAGAFVIAAPPLRTPAGRSGRDGYREPRARKLSADQAAAIRAYGGGRSLRDLAAEFGVSYETIRAAQRPTRPASIRLGRGS